MDSVLENARVLFDGTPGTPLYVSSGQINAIVPCEVEGRFTTQVQVEFLGVRSNAITLDVAQTAPGVFTLAGSGRGPSAVLNADNSINGSTQPAAKGTIVTIYATGEGQTNPPSVTGTISGSVLKMPVAGVNDWRANGSGSLCRIGTRYGGGRVACERTCSRQRGLRFCCAVGPHSRWRKQPIRCNHRGAVES